MFSAIRSLYDSVRSCVRINGPKTDWFDVYIGLRQGFNLSPSLFNLFIDDLSVSVKALGKGIDVGDERMCILMYADDLVFLADNEHDLLFMLASLNSWRHKNHMSVNSNKSQIVHFRPRSVHRSNYSFKCGSDNLCIVEQYVYLGHTLDFEGERNLKAYCASK